MRFYTTEKISAKLSKTPEGFLLCEDVPIARTGLMIYGDGETPLDSGPDGYVRIERTPDEVFREETIASFNGKPIVDEHPPEDVNPDNWKSLAKGVALNPRRGKGIQDDLLLADLLITDQSLIKDVEQGKREVSCGYDADYEELRPGVGMQLNMIGNHVALVESGRCGPRCRILDHSLKEKSNMSKRSTVWDRIRQAFKAKDEGEFNEALNEAQEGVQPQSDNEPAHTDNVETHIHIHPTGPVKEEKGGPAGETVLSGDDRRRGKDDRVVGRHSFTDDEIGERFQALETQIEEICAKLDKLLGEEEGEEQEEGEGEGEGSEDSRRRGKDTDFFEGAGGAIHPIRGTKGYSKKKTSGDDDDDRKAAKDRRKGRDDDDDRKAKDDDDDDDRRTKDDDLEGNLEMEAPPGTSDRARKARDSAYLRESFQETVALAEIIAPGIRIPVFDRAAEAKKTYDNICGLRRKALQIGSNDAKTLGMIETAQGGKDFEPTQLKKMTCDAVRQLFLAVGGMKRAGNSAASEPTEGVGGGLGIRGSVKTPADLNKRLAELYGPNN